MKIYLGEMFHPDAVDWLYQHADVVQDFNHIEELDCFETNCNEFAANNSCLDVWNLKLLL